MKRCRAVWSGAVLLVSSAAVMLPVSPRVTAAPAVSGAKAVEHLVVIYEENHSFDNLYGLWPGVNGLGSAGTQHTVQVGLDGKPLSCLLQNDVNLTSPPLAARCTDTTVTPSFVSAFPNAPFKIDDFIAPTDLTCAPPGTAAANGTLKNSSGAQPGGCTRDLVHRFYQEQYQINGGQMNRYTVGSDAVGLTQGYYDTTQLPIYKYLTGAGAPKYVIADNFFQAAFGGSFLNHQWLVSSQTPVFVGADHSGTTTDLHTILGADGHPSTYPLHPAVGLTKDAALTVDTNPDGTCASPATTACGDFAVNTMQPTFQPFGGGAKLPPLTSSNIGDELSAASVDWAWYAGGWSNAAGEVNAPGWTNGPGPTCADPLAHAGATYPFCADALFQYHHQPLNYFANYAPGTAARAAHLKDEVEFINAAKTGQLKPVSFVKPVGEENEHPGYASTTTGSSHLVDLIKAIENGPQASSTVIVVTYDEFGGQWDHVPPPTAPGVSDKWGPGTRIPALVISPMLTKTGVDHTQYDTTSILATIERLHGLAPLTSRDASVNDLLGVLPVIPAGASRFVPLTPVRILDTRPESRVGYTGAKPSAAADVRVPVRGLGGVPVGASAAVINLTATEADGAGYVQAFPTAAGTVGASSNLNVERAGQTIPNSATVPIGADGSITLHTQSGTHLIVDVEGYYLPTSAAVADGRLVPVTPARIFDTRPGSPIGYTGPKPGNRATTRVAVGGRGGIPARGVEAAVLNVTATEASGPGFVQVAPAGRLAPGASSNLNLERAGETIANQVIVPVGTDGAVDIYTQTGAHLVVDVAGYVTDGTVPAATAGLFVPVDPGRLLDTRAASRIGYTGSTPGAGARVVVTVTGRLGLAPTGVGAVAANLTITEAAGAGFVQAAPAGLLQPGASSNLNAESAGQTIANAAVIPVSSTGFELFTQTGGHLIADVAGWYIS